MMMSLNQQREDGSRRIKDDPLMVKAAAGALTRPQAKVYVLYQYRTALVWPVFLAKAFSYAENPVLRRALHANANDEIGAKRGNVSHVVLAERFATSFGVAYEELGHWAKWETSDMSISRMHEVARWNDAKKAGWMGANEAYAADMFGAVLPTFRAFGCDTEYLETHVTVDPEQHVADVLRAYRSILRNGGDPNDIAEGQQHGFQARVDYIALISKGRMAA